jgi:GAF domain-containing protein
MATHLTIETDDKATIYRTLLPQIKALVEGEADPVANMANVAAALREALGFFWVGFYLVRGNELVLGPFQGSIACTRIQKGKGVCGHAWSTGASIVVPDVDAFPGHIACSSLSRSEIVVPLIKNGEVCGVLDVDSDRLNDFDAVDEAALNELCAWFATRI